ncbi:Bifunctional riboflavin biosynthesis protein RIBA 1, chloroplastic [Capsicum annuum]|uniref:bifunctional riboflavin biosynthesis protein RIBA 1, chloroplastic n=1 Tax=Capsicum annuum TaxID=4072 RepID=UPI001FB0731B|nr:bifunctional riboflavin biosynthesis protein RIBA 1, chloroplastic [Capsicum annuum]KAF3659379.1 Bifunctional riboflavin biosynthesis protein RIBA 1, chloroplastic [Capsicum annuum]KAF3672151.1 Bifunctional riboflavin biosynthesis protein RIBA 1, chloroplastic [Capsicum annuum]
MASINISFPSTSLSRPQALKNFKLFNGLHSGDLYTANGVSSESFIRHNARAHLAIKNDFKINSAFLSGEGDVRSQSRGESSLFSSLSTGTETQTDAVSFGTLAADIVPTTSGFPLDDDEFDLDHPTEGFSSIPEAIEDIRQGKMVLVTDDEDRENEGDLVMAASKATPEAMAFFVKHGTGIVCVSMVEEDLERLQLPLMVNDKKNEEKLCTAFTVSVDAKHGTTTGVSAHDRATTVLTLASKDSKPEDFNRPGHIFPLKYRPGGVLKRAGHTEASVDLAVLAGLDPVGVICEVVDEDGSMARLPRLRQFAKEHNLKIISVADLIRYRRKRDQLVEHASAARIPTMWGPFTAHCFKSVIDGIEHIAMVKGDIGDGQDILVRVHSECLTGDIFHSARCDCGSQLALAMQQIEAAGKGVLVYLRGHEGRGIGLGHKLRAYNLQDAGRDTVEANEELGLPIDSREYGVGAQMLRDLGVRTMKLMTNNPAKYSGLKGYGLAISGRVPLLTPITKDNKRYLETKRAKMGHMYGLNLIRPTTNITTTNGKPNVETTTTTTI